MLAAYNLEVELHSWLFSRVTIGADSCLQDVQMFVPDLGAVIQWRVKKGRSRSP